VAFSLYIHIPWCESKCPYCDFNSHAAAAWPESDYVGALISEFERRAASPPWIGEPIRTIFFGGGTPSLFKPESIGALIETADRRFGIERDAEITLEANPGTVDLLKLRGFRSAGVNRISFGAQSFEPAILKFLGRIHNADQTREAAMMAHRAGFERLNLDLIFAVPGQTLESVRRDIESAAALEPDHISAYNLTFEEGTPFFGEMKRGRIVPESDDQQARIYAMVRSELPARGYKMYEISNYAPPGHESRHNLAYWRGESYLGLGAGAHSFALTRDRADASSLAALTRRQTRESESVGDLSRLAPAAKPPARERFSNRDHASLFPLPNQAKGPSLSPDQTETDLLSPRPDHSFLSPLPDQGEGEGEGNAFGRRWWNERSPARYIAAAARDGIAEAGAEVIDRRTAAGEFIFLNLRLREGFALSDFSARVGYDFDRLFGACTAQLFESRLLLRENGRVRLSDRGLELADSIFAEFV